MASSVVGFDVGSSTSYVVIASGGGLEVVLNDYSERSTPTCVAFSGDRQLVGTSAKMQHALNPSNTFTNFTRLVGKKFNSSAVSLEKNFTMNIFEDDQGSIVYKFSQNGVDYNLTPEQVMALQLNKLKEITESRTRNPVTNIVLNVPAYYTNSERCALVDAVRLTGMTCTRLVDDLTSVATAYGFYSRDLPAADAAPALVAFVISGYSSTQVAICAFNVGKMEVLATACDSSLGGRDFDRVLFEHFGSEFKVKYKLDINHSKKGCLKLLQECEKLKKRMTIDSSQLPIGVECLMEDIDFSSSMQRSDFEAQSSGLLQRYEAVIRSSMEKAQLNTDQIHSVEIVGGNSRVPCVKALISRVFGKECKTSLNADEAVARGCAFTAAMCSPAVKIREFAVTQWQPYRINIYCDETDNGPSGIALTYPLPRCCRVTMFCKDNCNLEARYEVSNSEGDNLIGRYKVWGPFEGERRRVQLSFSFDKCGIFEVKARLVEETIVECEVGSDNTKPNSDQINGGTAQSKDVHTTPSNGDTPKDDGAEQSTGSADSKTVAKDKAPKKTVRYHDLRVEALGLHLDETTLNKHRQSLVELLIRDGTERDRVNMKNALEEYVCDMRSKLNEEYKDYVTDVDRTNCLRSLNDMESWLYDAGANEGRQTYIDQLSKLETASKPVKNAFLAVQQFNSSLTNIKAVLSSIVAKEPNFDHLTPEQVGQLQSAVQQNAKLVEHFQRNFKDAKDPDAQISDINSKREAMEKSCYAIINTPKPAPRPEESDKDESSNVNNKNNQTADGDAANHCPSKNEKNEGMEVD